MLHERCGRVAATEPGTCSAAHRAESTAALPTESVLVRGGIRGLAAAGETCHGRPVSEAGSMSWQRTRPTASCHRATCPCCPGQPAEPARSPYRVARAGQPRGGAWDLWRDAGLRRLLLAPGLLALCWDVHVFVVPVRARACLPDTVIGSILGGFGIGAEAVDCDPAGGGTDLANGRCASGR